MKWLANEKPRNFQEFVGIKAQNNEPVSTWIVDRREQRGEYGSYCTHMWCIAELRFIHSTDESAVGGRERNVFLRVAHSSRGSFRALLLSTFLVGNCIEEFASNKLNLVAYLRLCASAPIAVVWLLRTSHFLNRKFCNFNFQCDCLFVLIRCVWLVWFHGAQANSIFI